MAFNTFVVISMQKYSSDPPLPVKCCEVVRDITSKHYKCGGHLVLLVGYKI